MLQRIAHPRLQQRPCNPRRRNSGTVAAPANSATPSCRLSPPAAPATPSISARKQGLCSRATINTPICSTNSFSSGCSCVHPSRAHSGPTLRLIRLNHAHPNAVPAFTLRSLHSPKHHIADLDRPIPRAHRQIQRRRPASGLTSCITAAPRSRKNSLNLIQRTGRKLFEQPQPKRLRRRRIHAVKHHIGARAPNPRRIAVWKHVLARRCKLHARKPLRAFQSFREFVISKVHRAIHPTQTIHHSPRGAPSMGSPQAGHARGVDLGSAWVGMSRLILLIPALL